MSRGPFVGIGVLVIDGERHERARYRIEVSKGAGGLQARGSLTGPPGDVLYAAFNAGVVHLELAGGEVVPIGATRSSLTERPPRLRFSVSGPMPGYTQ